MGHIKFFKTREVKSPNRAMSTEAGIDFFVPTFDEKMLKDIAEKNPKFAFDETFIVNKDNSLTKGLVIGPHERILIPAGIIVQIDDIYSALNAANKSGVATKKGLVKGAELIDSSYRGEVHISVINTSTTPVTIYEGEKLIQFVEITIKLSTLTEVSDISEINLNTERGDGGFGHTGTK